MRNQKNLWITISIAVAIIAIDQITKVVFINSSFSLLGDFLWVESEINYGAAFGIFKGARWWFVGFSFPVLFLLFYFLFSGRFSTHPMFQFSLGLLIAGIIGNLADRIFLGYVRDFLYFKFVKNFAIFNVADASLVVGCALVVIFILFVYKDKPQKKDQESGKVK